MKSVWIGFDPRETAAYAVTRASVQHYVSGMTPVRGLVLDELRRNGLYTRPTERRLGRLYDEISQHPMATEFAISRFLVPHLARFGWALFLDCDMMVRANLNELFALADPKYAVMCVKHNHQPITTIKMDNQIQSRYDRKNWSSVMLFNVGHPSNQKLTIEVVNSVPGRDLHRFCWLDDEEIGELPVEWNWLVGHTSATGEPKIVHYTDGGPWFAGFDAVPYADEWRNWLYRWAS